MAASASAFAPKGIIANRKARTTQAEGKGESLKRAGIFGVVAELGKGRAAELRQAAAENDAEKAKRLINNGAKVNARDESGATPLYWAAENNAAAVAKLLIDNGADVHAENIGGTMPLHRAAYYNATEVAKLLIDNGAAVNAKTKRGYTPLHFAMKHNRAEVAKLLIDNGATEDERQPPNRQACVNGEWVRVQLGGGASGRLPSWTKLEYFCRDDYDESKHIPPLQLRLHDTLHRDDYDESKHIPPLQLHDTLHTPTLSE